MKGGLKYDASMGAPPGLNVETSQKYIFDTNKTILFVNPNTEKIFCFHLFLQKSLSTKYSPTPME